MTHLSDEELCRRYVCWPERRHMNPRRMRETLDAVRRFIDFDQTIGHWVRRPDRADYRIELYPEMLGIPTRRFLAEEPYVIQSWAGYPWNEVLWELYVERPDAMPLPEMVIAPPGFEIPPERRIEFVHGKDFSPFRIRGKIIIDDMFPSEIRAPGCVSLFPRESVA